MRKGKEDLQHVQEKRPAVSIATKRTVLGDLSSHQKCSETLGEWGCAEGSGLFLGKKQGTKTSSRKERGIALSSIREEGRRDSGVIPFLTATGERGRRFVFT